MSRLSRSITSGAGAGAGVPGGVANGMDVLVLVAVSNKPIPWHTLLQVGHFAERLSHSCKQGGWYLAETQQSGYAKFPSMSAMHMTQVGWVPEALASGASFRVACEGRK